MQSNAEQAGNAYDARTRDVMMKALSMRQPWAALIALGKRTFSCRRSCIGVRPCTCRGARSRCPSARDDSRLGRRAIDVEHRWQLIVLGNRLGGLGLLTWALRPRRCPTALACPGLSHSRQIPRNERLHLLL